VHNKIEERGVIMNETGRRRKIDISSKVTGKLVEGKMILYVDDRAIGNMSLINTTDQQPHFEFEPNYGIEQNKVYQIQQVGVEDDHYVEGCDMGWC
jgi:hypothetical protein